MRWLRCKNITPKNRINLDFPLCVCSGLTHIHVARTLNVCVYACPDHVWKEKKLHYMCYKREALVTVNIRLFAFFSLNVRLLFDIDNFFFIHFNSPGYFSLRSFCKPFWFPLHSVLRSQRCRCCVHYSGGVCTMYTFGTWTFFLSAVLEYGWCESETIQFPCVLVVRSEWDRKMCWDFSF